MIGDAIDIFRNTTPAGNKSLLQKVQLRLVPVTVSNSQKFDMSIMFFKNRHFVTQCLKHLQSKQSKNEQY